MTEQEKVDVQALLDALPRCQQRGRCGEEPCREIAVMCHPTAVIGDWALRCAKHPGARDNDYDDIEYPARWAEAVARLATQGFRSTRQVAPSITDVLEEP